MYTYPHVYSIYNIYIHMLLFILRFQFKYSIVRKAVLISIAQIAFILCYCFSTVLFYVFFCHCHCLNVHYLLIYEILKSVAHSRM